MLWSQIGRYFFRLNRTNADACGIISDMHHIVSVNQLNSLRPSDAYMRR